jgi:alkylphosphonate utilization operon protein PhnA
MNGRPPRHAREPCVSIRCKRQCPARTAIRLLIKDLKLRGGSGVVKQGTKVKNIRLVDEDHDIDCKIEGLGPMKLKSEYVKKQA